MMKLLAGSLIAIGCHGSCGLDLERMAEQPRFSTYEACRICPDGTIMMRPPEGTVHRGAEIVAVEIARGRGATGTPVEAIPIAVDAALLARGRNRFDIYCAACHGRLGDGVSKVAENMTLRHPPNLLTPPIASRPPGHHYTVIAEGFGVMRSYAGELTIRDRWAVVAYLEVLRLAPRVTLDELPPPRQAAARRELR